MKINFYSVCVITLMVISIGNLHAQTNIFPSTGSAGIGNTAPNASSLLEIKSTTKGLLIPRMTKTQRDAIITPATGLMIYQTNLTPGFYYYSGTAWTAVKSKGWSLTGNAGTIPGTNFIGTTDNQPLRFRVNNAWAGEIHPTNGNVFFGLEAGASNTGGQSNTAIGVHSLFANTDGYNNTANGNYALSFNTTGYENTANGSTSLFFNTTGSNNTASGSRALFNNTTGSFNTATGVDALLANGIGNNNTAHGYQALFSNTEGTANTANGYQALYSNTGFDNIGIGSQALYRNTNGFRNTANGVQALYYNISGEGNTANGYRALYFNASSNNTAIGYDALYDNLSGYSNTAIGYDALSNNKDGNNNIAIGAGSGTAVNTPNIYNTISIGNNDILNAYQNQVLIGNTSIGFIGGRVTWSTYSDARIKNTITEDVKGLDFIMRLRPVTYHISNKAITAITGNKETPDFPGKYDGEKVKYTGFIAQEVEQAAKGAGYDFSGYAAPKNKWGLYTISYEQFVVPLVKAVQELSNGNDEVRMMNDELKKRDKEQQQQIDELKSMVLSLQQNFNNFNPCGNTNSIQSSKIISVSNASLQQNIPNPFNHNTSIGYTLPQKFTNAQVIITDKNGKILKAVNISVSGKGSLKVDASTLSSGAYKYSLYVDGKLIDTKQMILIK